MPHFVLIDHSVQDTIGHHYEYAMRVLEAAQKAGYTPVLGANARFRPQAAPPFRVEPIYPDGFWSRMAAPRKAAWTANLIHKAARSLANFRHRLWFSRWGFLWLIRKEPFAYLRYHPFDSAIGSVFLLCIAAPIWLGRWLAGIVVTLIPFRKYWSGLGTAIWRPAVDAAIRAVDAVSATGAMADWRFARRKEKSFGLGTLQLLRSLNLGSDDIVFVPTLAEPEMLGLLRVLGELKAADLPSYHLLFRRNLFEGREPDFDAQMNAILPVRNAFLRFQPALAARRMYFYTDTEELSRQFNRLQIFPFRTCPIPHTTPAPSDGPHAAPLQITYLGDARIEKGYQLLPGLVHDLWQSHVETGRVNFLFQSNYNVEPGEPEAIVARSQLGVFPRDKVRLVLETCSSAEYREILLSASVVVLPYRADLYYARSSGVLVEALAAGIPVVVPATSWLAKQIADPAYRSLGELAAKHALPQHRRRQWIRDGIARTVAQYDPEVLTFGGETEKAHTVVSPPLGARALLISFGFDPRPGQFVTCYVDQMDAQGRRLSFTEQQLGPGYTEWTARVGFRLHARTHRIWIAVRNAFSDDLMRVQNPSVQFLGDDPSGTPWPLSAVGVTFSEPTSHGLTLAVREVLDHYPHYRRTARAHSGSVYEFHNAANLIRTLSSAGAPQKTAALVAPGGGEN